VKKQAQALQHKKKLPPLGLIFGEDENDAEALKNLVSALWPEAPRFEYRRKPLILMRDQKEAEDRKKNALAVLAVVKAGSVKNEIRAVIAHADCDALEPAHVDLSKKIKAELTAQGVPSAIAATPAWEMEAWWYLWPEAVRRTNSNWRALTRKGNHGYIENVKEQLKRDLRSKTARDYEESDARKISLNVKELGIINARQGSSSSFELFAANVAELQAPAP